MAQSDIFTPDIPGVPAGLQIWINYHSGNLRLQSAEWDNPHGVTAQVRIWVDSSLVYDEAISATSGSQNIPGNYQMVEGVDGLELPDNVLYSFGFEG